MNVAALTELASAAGLQADWVDHLGIAHSVAPDSLRALLGLLGLPADSDREVRDSLRRLAVDDAAGPPLLTADQGRPIPLAGDAAVAGTPFVLELEDGGREEGRLLPGPGRDAALPAVAKSGYHRLWFADRFHVLAVAPARCYGFADAWAAAGTQRGSGAPGGQDAPRAWALAAQVYALCEDGDGGIGTYAALARLARRSAAVGADALATSPVHALFSADPARCSPYAPSSRLFLNVLHVDPARALPGAHATRILQDAPAAPAGSPLIDWARSGEARLAQLRSLWQGLAEDAPHRQAFEAWRRERGDALEDHARFEALHAHFDGPGGGWRAFAPRYRDPRGEAVAAFACEHGETVAFHAFTQWLAARGLAGAQRSARAAGMRIGLIADLAIGADPGGSHVWSRQRETITGASIGAPPDLLAPDGQDWGLAAFSPAAMRASGYAAFLELLRATMRDAGGLRIDHVMGLLRLWMIPAGAASIEGAYLHYPLDDLLRLVALESWRHRCIVIGEDLGTVPEGFRERAAASGVYGMSVLQFEHDADGLRAAPAWRRDAVAMTSTHDTPTLAGWWRGRDLELRAAIAGDPPHVAAEARRRRDAERAGLWRPLELGDGDGAVAAADDRAAERRFVDAAIAHVAATPAPLAVVPIEDLLGLPEQPNLPGTTDEHPNWRRRLDTGQTRLQGADARRRLRLLSARTRPTR